MKELLPLANLIRNYYIVISILFKQFIDHIVSKTYIITNLGDMIFYPLPMFVSLVVHGLQAATISYMVHKGKESFAKSLVATLVGAVIMVVGYTLGKTFVYSTFEYAMMKLPYEIAQALIGVIGSLLLCYKAGLLKIFKKMELA